jgi:hypothetical protein
MGAPREASSGDHLCRRRHNCRADGQDSAHAGSAPLGLDRLYDPISRCVATPTARILGRRSQTRPSSLLHMNPADSQTEERIGKGSPTLSTRPEGSTRCRVPLSRPPEVDSLSGGETRPVSGAGDTCLGRVAIPTGRWQTHDTKRAWICPDPVLPSPLSRFLVSGDAMTDRQNQVTSESSLHGCEQGPTRSQSGARVLGGAPRQPALGPRVARQLIWLAAAWLCWPTGRGGQP